ncbi:MAG: hypothetical protein WCP46_07445, partial [Alphaproteobacteria bacterium]
IIATKNPRKIGTLIYAMLIAVIFHSAYNFLVLDRTIFLGYFIILLLVILAIINLVNFIRINARLAQD